MDKMEWKVCDGNKGERDQELLSILREIRDSIRALQADVSEIKAQQTAPMRVNARICDQ